MYMDLGWIGWVHGSPLILARVDGFKSGARRNPELDYPDIRHSTSSPLFLYFILSIFPFCSSTERTLNPIEGPEQAMFIKVHRLCRLQDSVVSYS